MDRSAWHSSQTCSSLALREPASPLARPMSINRSNISISPQVWIIDVDPFDPSVAPGIVTLEPGGLSYDEMKALLAALAGRRDLRIRGFDLVEVNPLLDHNGITALLASRVILDSLGMIWGDEEGLP
jgi:hypothetical protein